MGTQPMSTAVHRSPNKLWRSTFHLRKGRTSDRVRKRWAIEIGSQWSFESQRMNGYVRVVAWLVG